MAKQHLLLLALWFAIPATVNSAEPNDAPDRRGVQVEGKSLLTRSLEAVTSGGPTTPPRGLGVSGDAADRSVLPTVPNQERVIPHCLMITDLAVVNNERATQGGPWSFGYLMRAMANTASTGIVPEVFVRRWLAHWEHDQTINGFTVEKREEIRTVIDSWPKKEDGVLDLDRAPFRLLAIVNRIDLRNNAVLGIPRIDGGGAGEARFVFCLLDDAGVPQNFTIIFEFAVKRVTFEAVQEWGRRWYDLKDVPMGSDAYLQRLESITQEFASAAADPESPPNGSALAQLRTNEIALGELWELREFRIDVGGSGYLRQVTVKQTPDISFTHTQTLLDFITNKQDDIRAKRYAVPVEFPPGSPFVTGSALMRVNFRWTLQDGAPTELEEARRQFASHTCNGCHFAETGTQFVHIVPRRQTQAARLSQFLTKPDTGDLAQRERDLRKLVEDGRGYEANRLPLQFVH